MKQEDRDKPDALEAGAIAANAPDHAPVHAGGEAPPPDREELAPTEEFVAVEEPPAADDAEPPAAEEQEPVPPPPPPPQNGTSPPVSPGPDEAGTLLLTKAAHDVRILVSYLSRRDRKKLEGANLDLTGADRIASGDYSVQLEADLWRQLGQLSEAARPASAESIADSRYFVTISGTETEQQSRAGKKLRRVRFAAVAALVLTFVLGVYVSLTSTAVVQTRADIAERHRIILGQYENTRAALDAATQPPDGQANSEAQEGAGAAGAAETADALSPEALSRQRTLVTFALAELQGEIRTGYALILPVWFGADPQFGTFEADNEQYQVYNVVLLDIQENINRILENFVIPMLGAFLGVAVYIIRDTNVRQESVALSPMDADAYWPRILLGLVAGLTIGWLTPTNPTAGAFLPAEAIGVLQNLSKAAVAFVVGYAIEVLFNILDAIKVALGVRDEKPHQKEGAAN